MASAASMCGRTSPQIAAAGVPDEKPLVDAAAEDQVAGEAERYAAPPPCPPSSMRPLPPDPIFDEFADDRKPGYA